MHQPPSSSFRTADTDTALIVFAKPPTPGEVKTRLTKLLSDQEAAALYESFLADSIERYGRLNASLRIYSSPPGDAFPDHLVPERATVFEQSGDGLGERMQQAFADTFRDGFERAIIIGTDIPSLPLDFVTKGLNKLAGTSDVVIGPSRDGGYYLLGMTDLYEHIFLEAYSHSDVFEVTLAEIRAAGITHEILPEWYDVDDPADLSRLTADLSDDPVRAPRTWEQLVTLQTSYPMLIGEK